MFSCPSLGYGNFGVFPSIWVEGHQKSLVCKLGIIGISFHTPIYVFLGLKMAIITIFGPILLIFDLERSGFHQMMQEHYTNDLQLSNHEYKITVFPIL